MVTPLVSGGLLLVGGYAALYLGAGAAFMVAAPAFVTLNLIRSTPARRTI